MATHNACSENSTHIALLHGAMAPLPPLLSAASVSDGGLSTKMSIDDYIMVVNSTSMPSTLDNAMPPSRLNGISTPPAPMGINLDESGLVNADDNLSQWKFDKDVDESCTILRRHSDGGAAINSVPTIITGEPLFRHLMCVDMMNTNKRKPSPLLLGMRGLKKPKLAHAPLCQLDFSGRGDAALDDEVDHEGVSFGEMCARKNIHSERNRFIETLNSLREAVPKNINKMDKSSIIGDAIHYVQDLQKQVETLEGDIQTLEACKHGGLDGAFNYVEDDMDSMVLSPMSVPEHKILELHVSKVEDQTYHLKIHCKKAPGVLVQLTRVFEALDYEIINAILSSVSNHILNTIVMKVKKEEVLEAEELKNMLLKVASKFGLSL